MGGWRWRDMPHRLADPPVPPGSPAGHRTPVAIDLDVPAGTRLRLPAGEWYPRPGRPAEREALITVVAVYRQQINGLVWVRGHTCAHSRPDCGSGACFEGQVSVAAIRANLVEAR